jgi:membrane-bound lytic murein transglycosylase B
LERSSSTGRWSCSITVSLLLAAATALAGCGVGTGTAGRVTTRAVGPSALAAEIERSQAVIDDAAATPAMVARAARAEQLAFRRLAGRASLRRATIARLATPAARRAAIAALRAADALAQIVPRESRFPHWRIVAPPPPRRLLGYFRHAAARYRLPWQYLAAIELVETRMGRIHGLSPAGARGPMQFMPATWAEYGHGDIDSQHDSIMAAARFLAANGARRSMAGALFHYNPSRSYVAAVESYAREMRRDRRAFYGYYYWQVLYRTVKGTFLLPTGYPRARPERLPG